MNRPILVALVVLSTVLRLSAAENATPAIRESARQIPVAYDVDVVVVGGSTGAVSAAVAAAEAGAKVFLLAPRPYLGEDMCATMRLWLEEGETPATALAKKVFADPGPEKAALDPNAYPLKYQADLPSAAPHKDTNPPSRLADGVLGPASSQSVQYEGDVTITADLGSVQSLKAARAALFYRAGDFDPESVTVEVSDDKQAWRAAGTTQCQGSLDESLVVSLPLDVKARYARFLIKRRPGSKRILVGEIMLIGPTPQPATVPSGKPERRPVRPMYVKKVLDDALLAAKVPYLFSCYPTDIIRDAKGNVCGIVMANRAGRQAVLADVIIDATARASVARMAGGQFAPYPAGPQKFFWTSVGGQERNDAQVSSRKLGLAFGERQPGKPGDSFALIEHIVQIPMKDGSFGSFALAEQKARDLLTVEGLSANTEELFQVPPDAMMGEQTATAWTTIKDLNIGAFRPAGVGRMFVLGGCADVPRESAAKLMRPPALMEMGERVGYAAAAEAKAIIGHDQPKVAGARSASVAEGDVREILAGVRPMEKPGPTIPSPDRSIPVLGTYDVVVVGGGTGGAPAGISAARNGAKVLVLEYLHGLGGVGTQGLISSYYWGYRKGFTAEIAGGNKWEPLAKAEWYRKALREAGAEIWFGVVGCGAFVDGGTVRGVVVTTPQGRGVVLAKVVIDSTGNADVAAAAGAQTVHTNADEMAVQGTGLPPMRLEPGYTNTDFTIVDETDMVDLWHVLVYAKDKYANAFDLGQLIDTRERRRIIGDFTMTLPDAIIGRTYPDTISISYSNFDTHGYTVDPYLLVEHPEKKGFTVNIPYRCLLASGLEGILVTGLGISVHRDALPLVRMQADIQNQGYSAGLIAATAAKKNIALRSVDLKAIQKQLVAKEIIPETALTDRDNFPLPAAKVAEAVADVKEGKGMAIILTHTQQSLPLLKKAYAAATDEKEKLIYARILAVMGDNTGVTTLLAAVDAATWDKGWNYTGMGQFGSSLSDFDTLIVALGRTRDRRAVPVIVKKMAQLDARSEFSHHRACALALEAIGDPAAAGPLAELLSKPNMRGYAETSVAEAAERSGKNPNDNTTRSTSIRELSLARALFHCGDKDGLGRKILQEYAHDLRGHWARHAQAVLEEK